MSIPSSPSVGQFPQGIRADIPIQEATFMGIVADNDQLIAENTALREQLDKAKRIIGRYRNRQKQDAPSSYSQQYELDTRPDSPNRNMFEHLRMLLCQRDQQIAEQDEIIQNKDQIIARMHEDQDTVVNALRATIDRLENNIHTMEMERLYHRSLNRVNQQHLSPTDKDIIAEVRAYNRSLKNEPYAPNRICLGVLSSNLGVSDSTIARRIDDLAMNGIITKTTTEPTKADPKSHVDVALTPMLDNPMEIRRDVARNVGGDRTCKCGAKIRDKYSVHVCENGHVHVEDQPGTSTPYTEQKAFTVVIAGEEESIKQPELELEQVAQNRQHTKNELEQVAQNADDQATAQKVLEKIMQNYHVQYEPNRICKCGSQLWHPDITGDLACCRCEPIAIWPNSYDDALRLLFPSRSRKATCSTKSGAPF